MWRAYNYNNHFLISFSFGSFSFTVSHRRWVGEMHPEYISSLTLLEEPTFYSVVLLSLNSLQRTHELPFVLGTDHSYHGTSWKYFFFNIFISIHAFLHTNPASQAEVSSSINIKTEALTDQVMIIILSIIIKKLLLIVFTTCAVWHNLLKIHFLQWTFT